MTGYTAPLSDITFVLQDVVGLPAIAGLPGFEEATPDLAASILDEAAKIAGDVLAPLNRAGDTIGAKWDAGRVSLPDGWKEAWDALVEGGWNGLPYPADYGGMGLPNLLNMGVLEMWQSANMAFSLCPLLTQGAVNAISQYGSDAQKATYLPKMVPGAWAGTMNLTEPQAGSDLAAVRSRAVPEGDAFRISGQKIFITYGEHEMSENIVHLVLARLPDAPPGVKGISLFIVPKFLVNADGSIGDRNDVVCASIEHKLGIHGSPTAVLVFGEKGGALGEIVGEPGRGLEYMFAMMNHARLNVGLQGLSIAERAYQQARAYANERIQGKPVGWRDPATPPIVAHPDVKRLLVSMRARIEAMRGIIYETAAAGDVSHAHPDAAVRAAAKRKVDVLTPIAKGWSTETGCDVTSDGVQIHGGMGYIEETGAAQHFRDARITPIYEGTTAIQSNALVGGSGLREPGLGVRELFTEIDATVTAASRLPDVTKAGAALGAALATAREALDWLGEAANEEARLPFAASVPFLHLMGLLTGGWMLTRGAVAAAKGAGPDAEFRKARIAIADIFAAQYLPQVAARFEAIRGSSAAVLAFDDAML